MDPTGTGVVQCKQRDGFSLMPRAHCERRAESRNGTAIAGMGGMELPTSLFSPQIVDALANPAAAVGFVAAAVVGVASSLHCFLMCGPLSCAGLVGRTVSRRSRWKAITSYQLGRIASYTFVTALLGAAGGAAASVLAVQIRPYLPWVMAAVLVATAFDLGKKLPGIPGLRSVAAWLGRLSAPLSAPARSGVIGALTPLLPCGLLYGILAASILSGSAAGGAAVGFGFSLGSAPALLAAQLQTGWMRKLPRWSALVIQRGVPLAAAAMIVYRAISLQAGGDSCH